MGVPKTIANELAYETYGELAPKGDNVVLISHALSGNAPVAGYNSPNERKPGFYQNLPS